MFVSSLLYIMRFSSFVCLLTLPLLLLLLLSWDTLLYLYCNELFYLLHFFVLCVDAIVLYNPIPHQLLCDLLIKLIR